MLLLFDQPLCFMQQCSLNQLHSSYDHSFPLKPAALADSRQQAMARKCKGRRDPRRQERGCHSVRQTSAT